MVVRALTAILLSVAVAVGSPAATAPGERHRDERIGYELRAPSGWTQVPVKTGERWIVAKFVSEKKHRWVDPNLGWSWVHYPELRVIAFLDESLRPAEEPATTETGSDDGEEGEDDDDEPEGYDGYLDYMRETYSGGGFHVADEETREHKGLPVTCYDIKVEKGSSRGPKRITTWVFDTEVGQVAVQVEVLEDSFDKLHSDIRRALRSFKVVERTQELFASTGSGSSWVSNLVLDLLPADQRWIRRRDLEQLAWEAAVAGLPDDWSSSVVDGIYVLNHADDRTAKTAVAHVKAVLEWLDETLPEIGPEEYVRTPIVRICQDWKEERSFRRGSDGAGWSGMGLEIVIHKDRSSGSDSYEWEWLNRRAMEIWFQDRDRDLYWALPYWLRNGLRNLLESAELKGSRLEFEADTTEKKYTREALREGPMSCAELMMLTRKDSRDLTRQRRWGGWAQSIGLTRYLLAGPGSKKKKTRGVLTDYLTNLKAVVERIDAELKESEDEEPQTEAEEDEFFKRRYEAWQERERRVLEETFDLTFGGWDDGDWRSFEQAFLRYLK